MDLQRELNPVFYGEPTGGNVNGYGDRRMLQLPNSKLEIWYSTKYFQFSPNYSKNFIPDVIIKPSFENFMKGIDDVYEAIKEVEITKN